jgi:hypothetical protein
MNGDAIPREVESGKQFGPIVRETAHGGTESLCHIRLHNFSLAVGFGVNNGRLAALTERRGHYRVHPEIRNVSGPSTGNYSIR